MIEYHYELEFKLDQEDKYTSWIKRLAETENKSIGDLTYIFCDDAYLIEMNRQYLDHDTYTDIITFDYTEGTILGGDIFISIERVKENALEFGVDFQDELLRVMAHGILHLSGYKDKEVEDVQLMRSKENEKIKLFHVEH